MEKREMFGTKDFFSKDFSFGKAHSAACDCAVCLQSDEIFDKLSLVADSITSEKVTSLESKKICDLLDSELLETLCCGNGVEFEQLLENYQEIWNQEIDGKQVNSLDDSHEESCKCIVCSVKKEITSKLDELCSSKSLDDSDFLEIVEERSLKTYNQVKPYEDKSKGAGCETNDASHSGVQTYLICEPHHPLILTTENGAVNSLHCANTLDEVFSVTKPAVDTSSSNNDGLTETTKSEIKLADLDLKRIEINEMVDICLCEPGKLSPYCFKHSIAYCQHMQTKLYEEGCSCDRESECLFCQRLKCNYCNHERSLPNTCPSVNDPLADDLTVKISSWLDDKLLEVGVSPDVIKQFSEPIDQLKTNKDGHETSDQVDVDLPQLLADHLERNTVEKQVWDANPITTDLIITDKMKDDILNMNELFDVRPFPRCYKLKGVKSSEGGYSGIEEEYTEIGFEAWKLPTQFPEDTLPLAAPFPGIEIRLEKEEDIRKRAKNHRSSLNQKKVKIVGLSDDWRPIVESSLDFTDYAETYSTVDKEAWAQKTYEEIMEKCEGPGEEMEENPVWSRVQPILDRYGEEISLSTSTDEQQSPHTDLEQLLQRGSEFAEKITKRFPNSKTIGYKPEFWRGLEKWKPPKNENAVRKRLIDEVKKFSKELDSFKNDFERALTGRPGVEINAEETLNKVIESLPPELRTKIERLKLELPEEWISDPELGLLELENSSIRRKSLVTESDVLMDSSIDEKTRAERTVSECDSLVMSDEDDVDAFGVKTEAFFYDDEEAEEMKKEMEMGATSDDLLGNEVPSTSKQPDTILDDQLPSIKNSISANFTHKPAPYVVKLKEEMMKNSPDGLHPTQKLWYDRPMYPYWTPSVIYDLSEIEKLFFDGVPEYSPNINESKLKAIENRLLNKDGTVSEDIKEKDKISTQATVSHDVDEPDAAAVQKHPHVAEQPKQDAKESKKTKSEKKSKRSALKSISDEDCLIKEDDFKAAIEQLLQAEASKKDSMQKEESSGGGALSLDHIYKGIAGQVKSVKEGAVELDSSKDFDLQSIIPCPALKYRFNLDIFQKQAIIALEAGLSVFVAAHTSAGKTVAAEYAIAMALRNGCRVVYTSPIKALSNQKYNDFTKKFKGQMKVGIITGDVQLNKEAECLIMTTEILRSMLYNQSSILSDLEYVIFDEVHYFNDPERGNVWEEVLILLPHQCQLVMLSATVPNVMNFASWVGTLRKREVIVTTTTRRPVPLKHYIHFSTKPKFVSKVLPVREAEGPFLSENFQAAIRAKESMSQNKKFFSLRTKQANDWTQFIIHHLQKHQRLPAVVFCFSRKRCDELASDILRKVDLVEDAKKKRHIESFFNRQINMLQQEDRDIQQIVTMKGLLQKGIGVHHSGILPILKEIVEVLFSESQIKLLFATETFAMGVNMPAKTVVFQQVGKYDGVERRSLKPGEYTQMAGRAGRRGIDKSGTVIITEWNTRMDKCVSEDDLRNMLIGSVDPLESQFRLRYSMILTAMKPEGENSIHSIIKKSFFDFSLKARKNKTQELTEKVYDELKKITEDMRMMPPNIRDILCGYCDISYQFFSHLENIREHMFEHRQFKTFLNIGRMVSVSYNRYVSVFGVILNVDQVSKTYDVAVMRSSQCHIRSLKEKYPEATEEDVTNWYRLVGFRKMELLPLNYVGRMDPQDSLELIQCKASDILRFVRVPHCKMNKGLAMNIIDVLKSPRRIYSQHVDNLSHFLMDAVMNVHSLVYLNEDEINFNHPLLREDVIKYHKLSRAFDENLFCIPLPPATKYPLLDYLEKCYWFHEKQRSIDKRKVQAQKEELKSLFKDFDSKLAFLKNNKYIKEDDDIVDTKGRIASRMTNFEVFITEILLTNVLEDLEGPETAALLSCLVIPGVSTEITDTTNQYNPLFKPIVDTSPDVLNIGTPGGGAPTRMNRHDLKKVTNTLRESEKDLGTKREDIEFTNSLIKKYLQLPPLLEDALDKVNSIRINLINQEDILEIEPMEGSDLSKVTFCLVPIVYAWAKGRPMREIMQVLVPNIQEGILVRWIINLNETIKDIDSAIHHFLKDSRIKEKFETASNCIKRGIIDTPSLYLNQRTQLT